jgi:hypothetical protein
MNIAQYVHDKVSAVCPIDGVAINNPADKSGWRIDFSSGATSDQKAAANAIITALDAAAVAQQIQLVDPALAALAESDIVVLRCMEGAVSVSAPWVTYRHTLRLIAAMDPSAPSTLPAKPSSYPPGS